MSSADSGICGLELEAPTVDLGLGHSPSQFDVFRVLDKKVLERFEAM